jgi:hypothetical protein
MSEAEGHGALGDGVVDDAKRFGGRTVMLLSSAALDCARTTLLANKIVAKTIPGYRIREMLYRTMLSHDEPQNCETETIQQPAAGAKRIAHVAAFLNSILPKFTGHVLGGTLSTR